MRALPVVLAGWLLGAVLLAAPASAHPLDETVQQLYVTPSSSGLTVQLDISPNVLVAPAFAAGVDVDGDRVLTPAETAAHTEVVRRALAVRVDGRDAPLRLVGERYPSATLLAAGGGTITLTWAADLAPGARDLLVHDAYAPGRTIVQAGVLVPPDPIPVSGIGHADGGRTLTAGLNGAVGSAVPDPAVPDPAVPDLRSRILRPRILRRRALPNRPGRRCSTRSAAR